MTPEKKPIISNLKEVEKRAKEKTRYVDQISDVSPVSAMTPVSAWKQERSQESER